jgi:hypothetical protein
MRDEVVLRGEGSCGSLWLGVRIGSGVLRETAGHGSLWVWLSRLVVERADV